MSVHSRWIWELSLIGSENPERIIALVARRDGNTLHDALSITATLTAPVDAPPTDTAPAEAVGEQVFDIHGRTAEVWTEPFEVPVQHVRFHGEPILRSPASMRSRSCKPRDQTRFVLSQPPTTPILRC